MVSRELGGKWCVSGDEVEDQLHDRGACFIDAFENQSKLMTKNEDMDY